MAKNKIQEQRMKRYFIDAAKEILRGEGISCLSVRNVSERAGYSYATMYNYFPDIKGLIFACITDFQDEIREFISEKRNSTLSPLNQIKNTCTFFIQYFVQLPGIFELFYLEKSSDINRSLDTNKSIKNFFFNLQEEDFILFAEENEFTHEQIAAISNRLHYIIVGGFLFYSNRLTGQDYRSFMLEMQKQIESILHHL